jgi:hypothetical protein
MLEGNFESSKNRPQRLKPLVYGTPTARLNRLRENSMNEGYGLQPVHRGNKKRL